MFCLFSFIFVSCLVSLRILCLASKVWLWEWFTAPTHSQLRTNKQPPTTKPDPKAPSSVFHPEFMNMQPQSHGTLVQVQMFFLFQLGVILLRFQPAPTTPLRLEASDSSCKRPKEDDPVASAKGHAMGIKKWHLHQGISGWVFFIPKNPSRTE